MEYRISSAESEEQKQKEQSFTGLGLTSRKNLCIHPEVSKEKKGVVVDARCRDLTNAAVCEKGRQNPGSVDLCDWHEVVLPHLRSIYFLNWSQDLGKLEPGNLIPPGIWTLADVLQYGRDNRYCPYFIVRRMVSIT